MSFPAPSGLIVSTAADLGDRQLWTPPPPPTTGVAPVSPLVVPPTVVPALQPPVPAMPAMPAALVPPPPAPQGPRRSHLVAKPALSIDYAAELVALKAELYLLTLRLVQLEQQAHTHPPPPPWRYRVRAWLQACWMALRARLGR